jgi:hypothetical protein
MEMVVGVIAFAIVAGWAGLSFWRHGRDPQALDDPSILAAAPPPEMTAATATVVTGGTPRVAFLAALLDLGSRDEIAFRDSSGSGGEAVGIEIHGGATSDPRVLINRRRPVGEGEAWLLSQLHLEAAIGAGQTDGAATGVGLTGMLGGLAAFAAGGGDALGATGAGMFTGARLDPDALAAAYQDRHGKPMPDGELQQLRLMVAASGLMARPEAMADPAALEAGLAAQGVHLTPEQDGEMRAWASQQAAAREARIAGSDSGPADITVPSPSVARSPIADPTAAGVATTDARPAVLPTQLEGAAGPSAPGALYIPPELARVLPAPIGFRSLIELYARTHGWIGGLSVIARWKWRCLGILEVAVGVVVGSIGGWTVDPLTTAGAGIALGGAVTWLIAPAMPARTASGALMVAQLQAYGRTLKLTFDQARTMDDAVGVAGLTWLETPDQALVWGVALGLRPEIEVLLQRTSTGPAAGGAAYEPQWYRSTNDASGARSADPGRMFAAIEAIGSQPDGGAALAATARHADVPPDP